MYCEAVQSDEISRIIANLPNKKSPGLDGFTPKLIKEIGSDIINLLTYTGWAKLNEATLHFCL